VVRRAFTLNSHTGFKTVADIVDYVKALWTRVLYGGKIREVVRDYPECWTVTPITARSINSLRGGE
jgi:hypothetical protein